MGSGYAGWMRNWWNGAASTVAQLAGYSSTDKFEGVDVISSDVKRETVWRPWHGAAAAQLQARIRAAADRPQRLAQQRMKKHAYATAQAQAALQVV
jgi:hypothetical protein